jgi:hypothetical protein
MMRTVATVVLCMAAIIAGDLIFRGSLLQQVRPLILTPRDQETVEPPVQLVWDGPERMRVRLSNVGGEPRDLGIRKSPVTIDGAEFPRDGGYQITIEHPTMGGWVAAERWFQVHVRPQSSEEEERPSRLGEIKDLLRALDAARRARDNARERTRFMRQENKALRDESERLAKQLETLYGEQDEEAARMAELERRLTRLSEELQALIDENTVLRQRLASVIPCTVWGYYSYPRPQTIPATRRMLMVGDTRGRIFRAQADCETIRRADPTAASICFCVGNSWGR